MDEFNFISRLHKEHVHAPPHYHGHIVRKSLFAAALLMVVSLPFISDSINVTVFVATLGIVVVTFLAGLTNPYQPIVILADTLTSLIGFCAFEFSAVAYYFSYKNISLNFLFYEAIALAFFIAFYFSTKTLRGMMIRKSPLPHATHDPVTGDSDI